MSPKASDGLARPPAHLSLAMRRYWTETVREYELAPHHLKVLQAGCEAWDRMVEARELVGRYGILIPDRVGGLRKNPAVGVEETARLQFLRAVRELALDEAVPDARPPRAGGRG